VLNNVNRNDVKFKIIGEHETQNWITRGREAEREAPFPVDDDWLLTIYPSWRYAERYPAPLQKTLV
jgi:hypothetical protein